MSDEALAAALSPPMSVVELGGLRLRLLPPAALPLRAAARLPCLAARDDDAARREHAGLITGRPPDDYHDWGREALNGLLSLWGALAAEHPPPPRARPPAGELRGNPITEALADVLHRFGGSPMDWLDTPFALVCALGEQIERVDARELQDGLSVATAAGGRRMSDRDYQSYRQSLRRSAEASAPVVDGESNTRSWEMMSVVGMEFIRTPRTEVTDE